PLIFRKYQPRLHLVNSNRFSLSFLFTFVKKSDNRSRYEIDTKAVKRLQRSQPYSTSFVLCDWKNIHHCLREFMDEYLLQKLCAAIPLLFQRRGQGWFVNTVPTYLFIAGHQPRKAKDC
ncbi:MAG: hypothetical protein K5660_05875, partial [Paludibacteraceae bacterium]|nr:hypothetical protein [Paludibacteraceae bacterium]